MQFEVYSLSVPKTGNRTTENEDSTSFKITQCGDLPVVLAAVSDGATESAYSDVWARILCEAYVSGRFPNTVEVATVKQLAMDWKTTIANHDMPWYLEQKVAEGSYAALLGATITQQQNNTSVADVRILSVGDCCIIKRSAQQHRFITYPQKDPSEFNCRPFLLGTKSDSFDIKHIKRTGRVLREGDVLMLMTDALACFFLKLLKTDQGNANEFIPWFTDQQQNEDAFRSRVVEARRSGLLKNDDTTVLTIRVSE